MSNFFKATTIICTLLISACGFHLRGNINLPAGVEPLAISGINETTTLALKLHNSLTANGIKMTDKASEANYKIVILETKQDRRVSTIGGRSTAKEYLLLETVVFELQNAKGVRVLGPNTIVERQVLTNDPNRVSSTNQEEKLIRQEMLNNVGGKIARQLSTFNYNTSPQQ